MRGFNLILLALAVLAVACGTPGEAAGDTTPTSTSLASAPSTVAETTTTTATTVTSTTVDPPSATTVGPGDPPGSLAEFEAFWLCQVSRQSYGDLGEIDQRRSELLEEAGFSEEAYLEFRSSLDGDPEAREEVMQAFLGVCADD